ncbi:hypothetical protein GF322_04780 [Candidatus Dependentiae bacterium]|nr:hypothetical protein [Candidatus Dependentiae bacterium]
MKIKKMEFVGLVLVVFVFLSINNSFGIFGQKPKETKPVEQQAGLSQSFAERSQQLKEQTAKTQPKMETQTSMAIETEEKKSLFKKFKSGARSLVGKTKEGAAKVQEKISTKMSPEKEVENGIIKIVTDNSGKLVNAVVEALRGIKVFPPVTQEVPQSLNIFRSEFGRKVGAFASSLALILVDELKEKGAFGRSLKIEALAENMKLEQEKKTSFLGKIKEVFLAIFKKKSEIAIGRIRNAISGCQNNLSDEIIIFINSFLKKEFDALIENDLSDLDIYLRGVIYIKTTEFKDLVSNEMVNFLKQQGVLK